jgi:hypothetical protein
VKTPNGSHFCCLALNGPRLKIKQEYELAPGLYVSDKQEALALEPHWIEWLGTIQANSFNESSLYITAVANTLSGIQDFPVHQSLDNRVRLLHHALVLLGCGYNNAVLMVGGETYSSGGMHIGPIRSGLTPCFRPFYRKPRSIESTDLEKAAKILSNLELMYRHVPGRLYRRLRKGFNVWVRGSEEGLEFAERFHAFVRSTEAIFKCTIARKRDAKRRKRMQRGPWREITSTFLQRGQTVIGPGPKNQALLKQLYEIRSNVEHIKDIKPGVRPVRGLHESDVFPFRALEAEILASAIYGHILMNDALFVAFSTETKIEGFWKRKADQRQRAWGPPLDLHAEAEAVFAPQVITDLY